MINERCQGAINQDLFENIKFILNVWTERKLERVFKILTKR